MKWVKSPDALVQAFDHCLPAAPGVERKAMYGYPCAFVNGHLFCGLHQDNIIVRLPAARRDALVAKGASVFEPMPGEAMKEYVVAPAEIAEDRESLRTLLREALEHALSLGAKPKKRSAAKKKKAPAKKAPAKKAPAKKAPAKKAPAKKAPAKKAPAKKAPAKKAPAKKKRARKAKRSR